MSPNTDSEEPFNPNEFLAIPKWINEEYFRPIVEQDVTDFASIKNFKPVAATQPGENYTSIMVRVIIDIELKGWSAYFLRCQANSNSNCSLSQMALSTKYRTY